MDCVKDIDFINTCKEDTFKTDDSELADSVNKIYNDASHIGMKAVLFNKDDLPLFMDLVHSKKDVNEEYYYDETIPFVTQCVAFALGIKNLNISVDSNDVQWIHDNHHNIVFDENGRQIGHFIYPERYKSEVILYKEPIRPQMCDYLDEDRYDFIDYDPPTIPCESNFSDQLKHVIKSHGIIDIKHIKDVNENTWIYSKFNNVILNEIGEQIGHMIFPFSLSDVGQSVIYERPIKPILNMV
jgi:hypothetical protein